MDCRYCIIPWFEGYSALPYCPTDCACCGRVPTNFHTYTHMWWNWLMIREWSRHKGELPCSEQDGVQTASLSMGSRVFIKYANCYMNCTLHTKLVCAFFFLFTSLFAMKSFDWNKSPSFRSREKDISWPDWKYIYIFHFSCLGKKNNPWLTYCYFSIRRRKKDEIHL